MGYGRAAGTTVQGRRRPVLHRLSRFCHAGRCGAGSVKQGLRPRERSEIFTDQATELTATSQARCTLELGPEGAGEPAPHWAQKVPKEVQLAEARYRSPARQWHGPAPLRRVAPGALVGPYGSLKLRDQRPRRMQEPRYRGRAIRVSSREQQRSRRRVPHNRIVTLTSEGPSRSLRRRGAP